MGKQPFGNFEWIPDYIKGEDVFVCASGPSVPHPDTDNWKLLMKKMNGAKKICVSHVMKFIDPDFLVFLDGSVTRTLTQDFTLEPYKTIVGRNINRAPGGNLARINYSGQPNIDPRKGFYGGFSTGWFALNLAVAMGAKTIYLIGHDCGGKKANFFDAMKVKGYSRGGPDRYVKMAAGYKQFEPWAHKIINVSKTSNITSFKKISLEEL